MQVRSGAVNAGVADQTDHVAGLDLHARLHAAWDRGQVEVLRKHGAAAVGDPYIEAAVLRIRSSLHAVDDAGVRGQHRLAPGFTQVDPAVTVAALAGPIARALSAEHAGIADRHPPHRARAGMQPGAAAHSLRPAGARPHRSTLP